MALYRHDWTMPNTGWRWRLDIVPYDGALTDTPEAMTVNAVPRVVGDLTIERSFDELPIGLVGEASCAITLVWSSLKADLKTRIRNKRNGDARNLFILYSDKGAGTTPTIVEFAGVPATLNAAEITREEDGSYMVVCELVDAVYGTLAATSGAEMCNAFAETNPKRYPTAWETNFGSIRRSDSYQSARFEQTRLSAGFKTATPNEVFTHMRANLSARLKVVAARTAATGTPVDVEAFDHTLQLPTAYTNVARFYRQEPSTFPRASNSTPLTQSTLHLITSVVDRDGNRIGGLMSAADKLGWARYESAWDFLKDWAETLCIKLYYHVTIATHSSLPYLRVTWYAMRTLESSGGITTVVSDRALNDGEIKTEDEAPSIGKAEARAVYAQAQPTTDYVVNAGVTRAERSFNVQCTVHSNLPTAKPETAVGDVVPGGTARFVDMYSKGLFETNMLMEVTGDANNPVKVHERTRLHYGTGALDYVETDNIVSQVLPALTTNAQREAHNLWVQQVQSVTGLAWLIPQFYSSVYGRDDLAYIEILWPQSGATVATDDIGRVHEITGTLATDLPGYGWSQALIVATTYDAVNGTILVRYLLWK